MMTPWMIVVMEFCVGFELLVAAMMAWVIYKLLRAPSPRPPPSLAEAHRMAPPPVNVILPANAERAGTEQVDAAHAAIRELKNTIEEHAAQLLYLTGHSDAHVLLGKAHAHYDLVGRIVKDAVAHAEEVSAANFKLHGETALMSATDKMQNALDFAEAHWLKGGAPFDKQEFRRRITAELGQSRGE